MNSLLLHNNNLSRKFVDLFAASNRHLIGPSPSQIRKSDFNYDKVADRQLAEILGDAEQPFDVIYIPFTLSNSNYFEYDGLVYAAHIRLTQKLQHHNVPIVFVGIDKPGNVAKISNLGSILFTPGIYFLKDQRKESKEQLEMLLTKNSKLELDEQDYSTFVKKLHITAPENYGSHHSLANEWGVKRMAQSIRFMPDQMNDLRHTFYMSEIHSSLYFKYLDGQRDRQSIEDGQEVFAHIPGIRNKKILLIDDEWSKGWYNILGAIFKYSEARFKCFTEFDKSENRDELLRKIDEYLQEVEDVDVFIIDMRLCDDDFEQPVDEYTGFLVAKKILELNRGNQVLIFTASNKAWNFQHASDIGCSGFLIKESPEYFFSVEESKKVFKNLRDNVKRAVERSYMKEVFADIEFARDALKSKVFRNEEVNKIVQSWTNKWGSFDQILDLILIDNQMARGQSLEIFNRMLEEISKLYIVSYNRESIIVYKDITASDEPERSIIKKDDSKNWITGIKVTKGDLNCFSESEKAKEWYRKQIVDIIDLPNMETIHEKEVENYSTTGYQILLFAKLKLLSSSRELKDLSEVRFLRNNLVAHSSPHRLKGGCKIEKEHIKLIGRVVKKISETISN